MKKIHTTIAELAQVLGRPVPTVGADKVLTELSTVMQAKPGSVCFCVPKYKRYLPDCEASVVIVPQSLQSMVRKTAVVWVDDAPLLVMNRLLNHFFPRMQPSRRIHPTAVIAEDVLLPDDVTIEAHVVIASGVRLGSGVWLKAAAVIEENVSIGAGSVIGSHAVLAHEVVVGQRCVVGPHAVLGTDGFGYYPTASGVEPIRHAGSVRLEDDVDVGAHVHISRGVLEDTVVGRGSKLDAHVNIAHNVKLGRGGFMAACSGVAGSTDIGDGFRVGGMCGIAGHISIADKVTIAGGSSVLRSIQKSGQYGSAIPVRSMRSWVQLNQYFEKMVPDTALSGRSHDVENS